MATINNKDFIDKIIAGNGRIDPEDAPDNPWVVKIVEYTNQWVGLTWAVVFENERYQDRYDKETEYISNPKVIWVRKSS
jgi:hypothetical protein